MGRWTCNCRKSVKRNSPPRPENSLSLYFIFYSKTTVLVWCGLKQAENELKTIVISDQRLSLVSRNWHFQLVFKRKRPLQKLLVVLNKIMANRVLGSCHVIAKKRNSKILKLKLVCYSVPDPEPHRSAYMQAPLDPDPDKGQGN
jgi:hypothetical protein